MIGTISAGEEDVAFEFEVFVSAKLAEIEMLARKEGRTLREAELEELLRKRFEAQRREFRVRHPGAKYEIVLYEDAPIGRMVTDASGDAIQLIDLALIKPYRGLGIGSQLIRSLKRNAIVLGKPVTLTVEPDNPALRLFRRHGFELCGRTAERLALVWELRGVE